MGDLPLTSELRLWMVRQQLMPMGFFDTGLPWDWQRCRPEDASDVCFKGPEDWMQQLTLIISGSRKYKEVYQLHTQTYTHWLVFRKSGLEFG